MSTYMRFMLIAVAVVVLGWAAYGVYLLWEKHQASKNPEKKKKGPTQAQVQMEDYAQKFQEQQKEKEEKRKRQAREDNKKSADSRREFDR